MKIKYVKPSRQDGLKYYDLQVKDNRNYALHNYTIVHNCGFDTLGAGKVTIHKPAKFNPWTKEIVKFIIPDSREGWVEALRWKLMGYFKGKPMPEFDYSQIREAGVPIKGFGGVSSGYKPLKQLLDSIDNILTPLINKKISTTAVVDIMNIIAKCVVSGNVRRSAEIALGDIDDEEYINLKNPELYPKELMDRRWASNNSVYAYVGKTNYSKIIENIKKNGEPGIVWIDNCKNFSRMKNGPDYKDKKVIGVNPCAEIPLESFECCNLVEVFPTNHDNIDEFLETLKYAYLYTKSVTLINTTSPETNAVMLKNRRIGVSVSGIIDSFKKFGRRRFLEDWMTKGYDRLKHWDEVYSDWLCIPRSKKISTVKPSGTTSILAGVSPGIHYPHSKYYMRRIRISNKSELIPKLKSAGYYIEEDKYSKDTLVISFPIKTEIFGRSKDEVTIWEQMNNVADLQKYWADNAVSVTVTFKEEEQNDLIRVLEVFEDKLKCVSFLKLNTTAYAQAPYETINEEKYLNMCKEISPIDFRDINEISIGESYCTNDSCEIKRR